MIERFAKAKSGQRFVFIPLPGFLAVISFWVRRLPCHRIHVPPTASARCVMLALFPLGALLQRYISLLQSKHLPDSSVPHNMPRVMLNIFCMCLTCDNVRM